MQLTGQQAASASASAERINWPRPPLASAAWAKMTNLICSCYLRLSAAVAANNRKWERATEKRKKGQKTWPTARQSGSSSGNLHTYKPELLFAHFIWQRRAMSVRPSISLTVCLTVTASVTECVCVCVSVWLHVCSAGIKIFSCIFQLPKLLFQFSSAK